MIKYIVSLHKLHLCTYVGIIFNCMIELIEGLHRAHFRIIKGSVKNAFALKHYIELNTNILILQVLRLF